jgi:hypothetical protein
MRLPPLAVGMGIYLPMSGDLAGDDRRADRLVVQPPHRTNARSGDARSISVFSSPPA